MAGWRAAHRLIRGELDPVSLVTMFNRLIAPAALVLLMAGVALLVPQTRPWLAPPLFLPLLMFVSLGTLWCSILVWRHSATGLVATAAWLLALAAVLFAMDRRFVRRGLRH